MNPKPKIPEGWRRLRVREIIRASDMANSKRLLKPIERYWINTICAGQYVLPDDMNYYYRRIAKKKKGRK